MKQVIIVRYAEIALKGGNRHLFEKQLVENIKHSLKAHDINYISIKRPRGRILVTLDDTVTIDRISFLSKVFGISSFSIAVICQPTMDVITETVLEIIDDIITKNNTFRVTAKRVEKNFKLKSMDIAKFVGSAIVEKTNAKVSLKEYEYNLGIELFDHHAYVFLEDQKKSRGPGGLPVGITGKVIVVIKDKKSIRCAELVMKRGCSVIFAVMSDSGIKIKDLQYFNDYSKLGTVEFKEIDKLEDLKIILEEEDKVFTLVFSDNYSKMQEYHKMFGSDVLILYPLAFD